MMYLIDHSFGGASLLTSLITIIYNAIIFILPAYIANATPTIFGGGTPLDLGKKLPDGRRIFGDHKTIRGLISGIICGTLTGILIPFLDSNISLYQSIIRACLLSIGTHIGDLFGSFIKRRLDLKPGQGAPVLDQLGFLVFALLITYPFYPIGIYEIFFLIILTAIAHPTTNLIAYILGIKDRPY